MKVYLSLGSNLGDRLLNLDTALKLLGRGGCRLIKKSSVYETEPLYFLKQPAFFNMAAACETSLSPEELLALISSVEAGLKRRRHFKNGPRTLDVDIIFYGAESISRPGLQVPHPRLAEREFVLIPLAEIAPGLRHPASGLTVKELLARIKVTGGVRRLPTTYGELEGWFRTLPLPAADAHYSLAPIKAALAALGNPEAGMGTVVHITGSNGKSSSSSIVAAALSSCGYSTGLYTSPHVKSIRERIKLDGRNINRKDFLSCFCRVQSVSAGDLSFFEILTAMAFLYFSLKKVRFSVIEAGLGGKLDATNAADGAVAGITTVSMEHLQFLGPRLENIAEHKAGIIKKGSSVLAGLPLPEPVMRIIKRRAAGCGARVYRPAPLPAAGASFTVPAFQYANAAFGLRAAQLAAGKARVKFKPELSLRSLLRAVPAGRFERFKLRGRTIIVDGAHNIEGIAALLKEFSGRPAVCVAAFMNDKDLGVIAGALAAGTDALILTRSLSYRSAAPEAVKKLLPPALRRGVRVAEDPLQALRLAVNQAPAGGTVLVAGSLYLAGDILAG
ncbi:MAG: 2-amino-4-hydroxy-6-hydroxymethyldihydropteridine diphosphokinase, partial [Elusimicrobia bacterium CG1_02_56_21]